MLRTYNGFDHNARMEGDRIQKEFFSKNPGLRPTTCCVCGSKNKIQLHLEDYNKPIEGIIPLCYRCHMMVHCRFRARKAWEAYKLLISKGYVFPPAKDFNDIRRALELESPSPLVMGNPRGKTFLDTLE